MAELEISYESLRKIQLQERNFGALSALDEEFYERYNLWVAEQKRLLQTEFNIETLKAYENAKKIVEEIAKKRSQKIVLKSLRDLGANTVDSAGLSKEEKSFYLNMLKNAREFENTVLQFTERKPEFKKEEEKITLQEKLLNLKILVAMSKFVAPNGNTYGPFQPGEIVSIDLEIGDFLLRKGIAQKTDVLEGIEVMESNNKTVEEKPKEKEAADTVYLN
ncbi:DNA replication complex GINS family protein [Candidatus Micrarchaeota archaeon]|nr:DNA replication complex GINS family protein [Candidatus Micrarchaeota archaeon]